MKRILITVFLLVVSLCVVGQNYDVYLKKAFEQLEKGDKENAERSYRVYQKMSGKSDKDFEILIKEFGKNTWQKSCYIINLGDGYALAVQKNVEPPKLKWQEANERCLSNRLGGFQDWRLPTKEELQIILANLTADPAGKNHRYYYWTSTKALKSKSEIEKYKKYYKQHKDSYFYVVNFQGEVTLYYDRDYHASDAVTYLVVRKYKL